MYLFMPQYNKRGKYIDDSSILRGMKKKIQAPLRQAQGKQN